MRLRCMINELLRAHHVSSICPLTFIDVFGTTVRTKITVLLRSERLQNTAGNLDKGQINNGTRSLARIRTQNKSVHLRQHSGYQQNREHKIVLCHFDNCNPSPNLGMEIFWF